MKKIVTFLLLTISLTLVASVAFAAEAGGTPSKDVLTFYGTVAFASAIAIALAAFGGSIGMGLGIGKAVEGIARNPEAGTKIMTNMIIGLALIESLAIYTLVIVLILLFMNPLGV